MAALNTLESADGVGVSTGGSTGRSTSAVDLTRYTALYINWNCWNHRHRANENAKSGIEIYGPKSTEFSLEHQILYLQKGQQWWSVEELQVAE